MPETAFPFTQQRAAQRGCPFLPALGGLLLVAGLLAACLPAAAGTPLPSPVPTASSTPSPTPVWFPPTATPTTPPPLPTPTVPALPLGGEPLLVDPLLDPAPWQLPQSMYGSVQVANGRLVIALHRQDFSLLTLRQTPILDDFYLEVRVRLSLCQGADAYGVLFRAQSPQDFYRLTLNCQNEIRLDRVQGGRRVYLQPPALSPEVPPVPPAEAVIGILARGEEMQIFLNGQLQFTVRDPVFRAGVIGFSAASQASSDMTIVFSDLTVYPLAP